MAPTHIRGRLRKADGGSTPASFQCLGAAQFNARFSACARGHDHRQTRSAGRAAKSCQRLVLMTSMAHCGPVDLARRRSPVSRVTCSASARAT